MSYSIYSEAMKLREYGRNVEMMVNYCRTLTDRDERNALSKEIVRIMSYMIPTPREGEDFTRKLWDHFYHLAEYDIDLDNDFPMPPPHTIFSRPKERMSYLTRRCRFRQYGQNIELMAEEAIAITDDEDRKLALVTLILNIMKMQIKGAEKDTNAELIVCEHLKMMSKGKLDYQPEDVRFHKYSRETIPPLANYSNAVYQRNTGAKKKKKKVMVNTNQKKYK